MRKSLGFVLVLSILMTVFIAVAPLIQAGEDKGTIGITCRPPGSSSRIEMSGDLEGNRAKLAEAEFRACLMSVMERWSERQIKANILKLEKSVDSNDAGVESPMIEGFGTYRNASQEMIDKLQKVKKKQATPQPK